MNFYDSIIEPAIFKGSMIVLSCFSDIADKKKKIAYSFRNTSYINKLSEVVKLTEGSVMDV